MGKIKDTKWAVVVKNKLVLVWLLYYGIIKNSHELKEKNSSLLLIFLPLVSLHLAVSV